MSLIHILTTKTIKERSSILTDYIKNNSNISPEDNEILKDIYIKYYVSDELNLKLNRSDIDYFYIALHPKFNNKCLWIKTTNGHETTSVKRMVGTKSNANARLTSTLRNIIDPQIKHFRETNTILSSDLCPITGQCIGSYTEVDHIIPFRELVKDWLFTLHSKPTPVFDNNNKLYTLNEPELSSWFEYHKKHAKLRYLSKEGHKIHTLSNK